MHGYGPVTADSLQLLVDLEYCFPTPASSATLAYQYMCWCDHFKYVPEYRATLFLQEELGQLYLLRSVMSLYCCKSISWCLEDSSCCDYIKSPLLCSQLIRLSYLSRTAECVLCLPGTVTCPLFKKPVLHKDLYAESIVQAHHVHVHGIKKAESYTQICIG